MGKKIISQLSIIPNYFCNYSCEYCYLGTKRQLKNVLDLNNLNKRILEIEKEYIINSISVYGGEVSLLPKEYIDKLCHILSNYDITITTNLSNEWLVDYCLNNNIHIASSLNQERNDYDDLLKKLITKKYKDKIHLSVVVLPSILNSNVDDLLDLYQKIGCDVYFIQYHPSVYNDLYHISQRDYNEFLKNILIKYHQKHYDFHIENEYIFQDLNYNPMQESYLFINPNGNYETVDYSNGIEFYTEFLTLKDWQEHCKKEEEWYFKNCSLCQWYRKCKAEHLVSLSYPDCSGMPDLINNMYKGKSDGKC